MDRLGPRHFLAIEKWDSMDALKAHAAAPGGLRRQDEGNDREPRDPNPRADLETSRGCATGTL